MSLEQSQYYPQEEKLFSIDGFIDTTINHHDEEQHEVYPFASDFKNLEGQLAIAGIHDTLSRSKPRNSTTADSHYRRHQTRH